MPAQLASKLASEASGPFTQPTFDLNSTESIFQFSQHVEKWKPQKFIKLKCYGDKNYKI